MLEASLSLSHVLLSDDQKMSRRLLMNTKESPAITPITMEAMQIISLDVSSVSMLHDTNGTMSAMARAMAVMIR
jgi:hypothetical protein